MDLGGICVNWILPPFFSLDPSLDSPIYSSKIAGVGPRMPTVRVAAEYQGLPLKYLRLLIFQTEILNPRPSLCKGCFYFEISDFQ